MRKRYTVFAKRLKLAEPMPGFGTVQNLRNWPVGLQKPFLTAANGMFSLIKSYG
jgi:hypothetical protein